MPLRLTHFLALLLQEAARFISPPPVAAEWFLLALTAAAVAVAPRPLLLSELRRRFQALAARRKLCICLCALLPALLRLSLLGVMPVPEPSIHDEFSHLLLGDTLAHGRLANPTPPLWRHFETIHVIQQPTYSSMYPPAQGMFLALGERLFHEPWAGVVISVSLMCAAACWMLQGWLPPAWALFGTLLLILKIGVFGFWMNSYMGGSAPAIGGALLLGALPRLENFPRLAAIWGSLGIVVLLNTRPFDGGLLTAAALISALPALRRAHRQIAIPAAAILLTGALFTGYYNWRVTGSPLRMPYQVNRDTYGWPENLGFLPAKKLVLRHAVLQDMYTKELNHRQIYASLRNFLDNLATRAYDNWTYLIGPLLTAPLLVLPWAIQHRRIRLLAVFLALILLLNLLQMVLYPYHLGAVVVCLFALIAQGCRNIYALLERNAPRRGACFALLLPAALILLAAIKQDAQALNLPLAYWEVAAEPHREDRAALTQWLSSRARKQLVIVRYVPGHSPDQEWVYNQAELEAAKVIWGREMDPASTSLLIQHYPDREIWLLKADEKPARVVPYPTPGP